MARIGAPRETWSGLLEALGGCHTCKPGGEAIWWTRNAQGLAARHHDATGHTTWANTTISVSYGDGHEVYEGGFAAQKQRDRQRAAQQHKD